MHIRTYQMWGVVLSFLSVAASLFLVGCRRSDKPGIDELKSTYQQTVDHYNSGRIDDYFDFFHDEVVYYAPRHNPPIEGKTAVRAYYDSFLSQAESVYWELIEPKFLVEGTTGIVWGTFRHTATDADGKAHVAVGRNTEVFTFSAGQWLKVYEHMSWFPVDEGAVKN